MDALGYLGLNHVFTANMTGNIVLLGLALGQGQVFAVLRSIVALGGFVVGVVIAALFVERDHQREEWPTGVTDALTVEWLILFLFTIAWHFPGSERTGGVVYVLIALSAVAMGIQSAAVRRLNLPGIQTTVVTGTLTSLMSGLVGWLGPTADERSSALGPAEKGAVSAESASQRKHRLRLQAAVFLLYGFAAVVSGIVQSRSPGLVTVSALVAVGLVAGLALLRHRRPQHP